MKNLLLLTMLTGCATTPVTLDHWLECEDACTPGFVTEACVTFMSGEACRCVYDDREPEVILLRK